MEVRVKRTTPIRALLDAGGWVLGATFENGIGQFVVDVTPDTVGWTYLNLIK